MAAPQPPQSSRAASVGAVVPVRGASTPGSRSVPSTILRTALSRRSRIESPRGGVRIAVTSTDPMVPLISDHVNKTAQKPVEFALEMLLAQRCFFPAHPAPRGSPAGRVATSRAPANAVINYDNLALLIFCPVPFSP